MGVKRNEHRIFAGMTERKIPLGRPRCRWVDNIKIDLREIRYGIIDWIGLTLDRDQWMALVNIVINLQVLKNVGKFLSNCTTRGLSRRSNLHGVT
jgi:hypothetical protein